jgi:catechol-2,3-dioxygenase
MATIAPVKFAHAVFRTRRFDEMVRWWCTVLGARPVFQNSFLAFLTYDDEHHRIAIVNVPNAAERPANAVGLEHVAYTYASLEALVATYRRLQAEGILPYWCVNHGPTTSMYYRDPDGNQVELQIDNFASVEELHGWFRSGAFAKNPIGVNYDPERLAKKLEAGVPASELVQQGAV